jgi:hypothetical protein
LSSLFYGFSRDRPLCVINGNRAVCVTVSGATLLEVDWSLRARWKVSLKNVAKESRRRGTHIRSLRKAWHSRGRPAAMRVRSAGDRLEKTPRRGAKLDPRIVSGAPA